MGSESDDGVVDVTAGQIADAEEIDWEAASSGAGEDTIRLLENLRKLQTIARFHTGEASPPCEWGPLQILEKIGQGSYGDVYRAWDPRLGRTVALKLLHQRRPDIIDSPLVAEGHLLARVRHPNVVTVHGAERIDGRTGLWMEFVDGETLQAIVTRDGPLSPDEVRHTGMQVASALAAVHDAGLLHRDIKAHNVMRDSHGRVVLMDFGAGGIAGATSETRLAGTPAYLAPEVLRGAIPTTAADIYACGVCLYYLATRSYPVAGHDLASIRAAHDRRQIPDPGLALAVGEPLARVIERAIAPESADRFASAESLHDALRDAVAPRAALNKVLIGVIAGFVMLAAALAAVPRFVAGTSLDGLLEIAPPHPPPIAGRSAEFPGPPAPEGPDAPGGGAPKPAPGSSSPSGVVLRQIDPAFQRTVNIRSVSVDGRTAFCTKLGEGAVALCDLQQSTVQTIRSPANRTERAPSGAVSPDGSRAAYSWSDPSQETIRVINADGSGDREVIHPSPGTNYRVLRWMDSDSVLVWNKSPDTNQQVQLLNVDTRQSRRLGEFAPEIGQFDVSPDGRFVAYAGPPEPGAQADIGVLDSITGKRSWVVTNPAEDNRPVWSLDGRMIVFFSERLGTTGVYGQRVDGDVAAGAAFLIQDMGRSSPMPLGFASDGSLFIRVTVNLTDIFAASVDLNSGRIGPGKRVDSRPADSFLSPDWSPDGQEFAYLTSTLSRQGGVIVIKNPSRGTSLELPLPGALERSNHVHWAPDGTRLAVSWFDFTANTNTIGLVDVGTREIRPVFRTPLNQPFIDFRWLPDGKRLLLASVPGIRVIDVTDGSVVPFYTRSRDGRQLAALGGFSISPDGRSIAIVTVGADLQPPACAVEVITDGKIVEVARFTDNCRSVIWTPEGRLLVSATDDYSVPSWLWLVDPHAGMPTRLPLRGDHLVDLSLRPDGGELLYRNGNPRPEVWSLTGLPKR